MSLDAGERRAVESLWYSLSAFASLWFLFGSGLKALVAALFVAGSLPLSMGARWLTRIVFALCLLALAVAFGFPHPDRWAAILGELPDFAARTSAALTEYSAKSQNGIVQR